MGIVMSIGTVSQSLDHIGASEMYIARTPLKIMVHFLYMILLAKTTLQFRQGSSDSGHCKRGSGLERVPDFL